jgi:hypothetical protein
MYKNNFSFRVERSDKNKSGLYITTQITGPHVCDTAQLKKKKTKIISPYKFNSNIKKKSRTDT